LIGPSNNEADPKLVVLGILMVLYINFIKILYIFLYFFLLKMVRIHLLTILYIDK